MEKTKKEWKDLTTSEKFAGGGCVVIMIVVILGLLGVFGGGNKKQPEVAVKECEQYETRAKVVSKKFLEGHLQYLGSSHIPGYTESSGSFSCEGKVFNFRDWVDAANGFGAKKRVDYMMTVEFLGGEWADMKNWKEMSFVYLDQ